ncbi:hypothetical protein TNCV_1719141 [Trichonephila clavipes]|nr:hypothetical protein TNCV_1719141 [Trichonephila clavipes]
MASLSHQSLPPSNLGRIDEEMVPQKAIRPGKLRIRVQIIIGKYEIGMCVGNLPTIVELEIGGIQKISIDKMIEEIIIEVPKGMDLRGTRGTMDSKTGTGMTEIIVDPIVITDDINSEIGTKKEF